MRDLPTGTVTFLFTDVEGSTRLLEELGAGYVDALAEHRRILRHAFAAHGGVEVDTQGDAFFVAFADADAALAAAEAAQAGLAATPIRVRMGIHTGEPLLWEEGYAGLDVHRAARICAAGHGGQVLVSDATRAAGGRELRPLGAHRLKDLQAPEPLWQLGDEEFPPPKSLSQSTLPVQATPFVGRDRELADLAALLGRDEVRLVTLTGAGGTGKTRLALQAAAEVVDRCPHGVWWVGLEAVRDPELVLPTIAAGLGARTDLFDHLAGKQLLLLLDNFEQVVDAAASLPGLLAASPGVRLLVTSRERLRLQAEHVYPVPTLDDADGVALFTARARALNPGFAADGAVAELCARLDHLPLAIELASARTTLFSPAQLLERLGRRLDLLQGRRDADPRQQTLRSTISWSHDLLEAEERRLFARLSVFAGGCTYEAAEEVCAAEADTLESLLDKSLLRRVDADGQSRFRMLESIREFAAEQLAASGEAAVCRDRHADHFLTLAEQADPELIGPDQAAWLRRLESDHDNLRAALAHLRTRAGGDAELRLAAALGRFWYMRGHFAEGRARLDGVLARRSEPAAARAACLRASAWLAQLQGNYDDAEPRATEALELWRSLGDQRGVLRGLSTLGTIAAGRRRREEARAHLEEGLAVAQQAGEQRSVGTFLASLGDLAIADGEYRAARRYCDQALDVLREVGDAQGVATAHFNLGLVALCLGGSGGAVPHLLEALRLSVELGDRETMVECVEALGAAAIDRQDAGAAARLLAAAEAVREELGLPIAPAEEVVRARALARLDEASDRRVVEGAWQAGRALSLDEAVAEALDG